MVKIGVTHTPLLPLGADLFFMNACPFPARKKDRVSAQFHPLLLLAFSWALSLNFMASCFSGNQFHNLKLHEAVMLVLCNAKSHHQESSEVPVTHLS